MVGVVFEDENLVSGQNIKTLNGESILGSGDIKIEIEGPNIDLELNPNSNNPIANSAVANAIKGGVHFKGIINSKSVPTLNYNAEGDKVIGTWYDYNEERHSKEFNEGDVIILVYHVDGYPDEPTKEYILTSGSDSETGYA
jgi:hypothetical protein